MGWVGYNRVMERHEAFVTEPTHDEEYLMRRWQSFCEDPKQSHWVWSYFLNRIGETIKTTEQIYVETAIDNYVKTNKRRKDSTADSGDDV